MPRFILRFGLVLYATRFWVKTPDPDLGGLQDLRGLKKE
jgi:hypothetical protein